MPAIAGFALLLLGYELYGFAGVHSLLADFHAFWCSGSAIANGADPYRASALSACERVPAPWGLYAAPAGVIVPAPLPPYALALFVPFSLLPYPAAAALWFAVLLAALCASVRMLAAVLRIPLAAAAVMLLLPATVLWLPYGEATPIALFGAILAAWAISAQKWTLAGLGIALVAIEPHLAPGVWIALWLCVPRARAAIAAAGVVLLGVSLAVHPGAFAEYLTQVLPLHALAEVPRPAQYSATWLAYAAGVAAPAALRIGEAAYAVALIGGIAAAISLYRKWNDAAVAVFAPLAFVVMGGTFVHASHIALALPFAAMMTVKTQGRTRAAAAVACAVLAVPWLQGGQAQTIALLGIAVATGTVLVLTGQRGLAFRVTLGTAVLAFALIAAHRSSAVLASAPAFPVLATRGELASAPWGRYVWSEQSAVTFADWLGKAPTWVALLVVAGAAANSAFPIVQRGRRMKSRYVSSA